MYLSINKNILKAFQLLIILIFDTSATIKEKNLYPVMFLE